MNYHGSLSILFLTALVPSAFAQLPKRVERCLPYPTLAHEINDLQSVASTPQVKVRIIRVEFDSTDRIPTGAQAEISADLQSRTFEPEASTDYLNELANEIAEASVTAALQNRGYFRVLASAKLTALQTERTDITAVAAIRATLGPQYRTGNVRIESAYSDIPLVISSETLRRLVPLQKGELFNVQTVRTGLRNLAQAYGREGYVDMTAEPQFQFDEAHSTIDMVVKIDQQTQYRVGSIEFLGINAFTQKKLTESLSKPGEIFDGTRLTQFFKANRATLPADASEEDVSIGKDSRAKIVAISFDFRTCPPTPN